MTPIVNGFFVGVTLSLMVGPALFMLIQTSLHRGFRYGINFAVGIFLSDALALFLAWFGVSRLLGEDPRNNLWFGLIGGIVLILFGAYLFMKPATKMRKGGEETVSIDAKEDIIEDMEIQPELAPSQEIAKELFVEDNPSKWYVYIIKGFVMNIVNPGVWFIWITAMVTVSSTFQGNVRSIILFFAATLLTVLSFDTLKAFVADRLKNILSAKFVHKMNQLVGIVLVIFGIYLIVNCFVDFQSMLMGLMPD
ncbi:MAG: LysE family transporter [Bacteroidales bacterium]|jgi:threonine/homoserine/homoserine lactone efflux protein|nr:LysE family transporter [Bacteroidales bacterium]